MSTAVTKKTTTLEPPPILRKPSLEPPGPGSHRRPSVMIDPNHLMRRPSVMMYDGHRKQSVIDTRSTLIMTSAQTTRANMKHENTYKLEPDQKFRNDKIKQVIKSNMERELNGITYDAQECTKLSKVLSETIKQEVKALGYGRFKIVAVVAIGQIQDLHPSVSFTSRCVWNEKSDTFAEYTFRSKTLYAVGLTYVLYSD